MDLYLKFKDKAEADNFIYIDASAEELQFVYQNTDVIGTIYKPTGIMLKDKEGMEYPEMKALDGYHVNVRLGADEDDTILEAYTIEPTNPVRVWG